MGICSSKKKDIHPPPPLKKECPYKGSIMMIDDVMIDEHYPNVCDEHRCEHPGCSKIRTANKYCEEHCNKPNAVYQIPECDVKDCHNIIKSKKNKYCIEHTCKYKNPSKTIKKRCRTCDVGVIGHDFCRSHRCSISGCQKQVCIRDCFTSMNCSDHTCKNKFCKKKVIRNENKDYCKKHECKMDGCKEEKTSDSYCIYHDDEPCKRCKQERHFGEYCNKCMVQGYGLDCSKSDESSF